MSSEEFAPFPGVTIKRGRMGGKPCLAGTRMPLYLVMEYLADAIGDPEPGKDPVTQTCEELGVTREQIGTALKYAARLIAQPDFLKGLL